MAAEDIKSISKNDLCLLHKPVHHTDLGEESGQVFWVELFYDLIHVVCIFQLGNLLSHHMSGHGFLVFAGLFTAMWISWATTTFYSSLYISHDPLHRFLVAVQMVGICIMAVAIPEIPGAGAVYFALAFAMVRGILGVLYWRVGHHNKSTRSLSRDFSQLFFTVSALFALSIFLPEPWIYVAWAVILLGEQLAFVLPKVGLMERERFAPDNEHLSERFALLVLIVMGEGFFKMILTLSDKGIANLESYTYYNAFFGCIWLFSLTWIYFDFIGNGHIRADKRSMMKWWYGHWLLMLAAVMNAVAVAGLMKATMLAPFPYAYGLLGCIGLALYLIATIIIENAIEERPVHRLYSTKLRLFGVFMALLTLLILPYVPAWFSGFTYMLAYLSQILVPLWRRRQWYRQLQQAT